jgi:CPA2 family monovalent cation:H+ antiporter-2
MHSIEFLGEIGVVLVAALLGGLVARALHLPVLVGYLVAGVVVGPHTPGFIADDRMVRSVADLGVALLMFAVGVQFSLHELNAVRRTALLGGGAQILGTILLGVLIGMALGWGVYGGVFLGCALSLSSTAVMMRVLEERGEIGTAHGTVMLGILVVQDLSLVLMMTLLPALASVGTEGGTAALATVGQALLRAALFLAVTLLFALRGAPALIGRVAATGSRDLFILMVVCLCLVAAVAADVAGLGLALGAFLAGVVVSESPYATRCFRRSGRCGTCSPRSFSFPWACSSIPLSLQRTGWRCLWWCLPSWWAKPCCQRGYLRVGLARANRHSCWLGLAQIGEFSFVLATVGSARNLIPCRDRKRYSVSALITILLAPFLYEAAGGVYTQLNRAPALSRWLNRQTTQEVGAFAHESRDNRVIILGCGRVGRYVSDSLRAKNVPHVAVDFEPTALSRLEAQGVRTVYGDASSSTVLEQTAPQAAELAIIALPEASTTEAAIRELRRLAP